MSPSTRGYWSTKKPAQKAHEGGLLAREGFTALSSVLSPTWTGPWPHHLLVKSYVAVTKWMRLMSDLQVMTFLSHFPFYFQETSSLSNYQFLFQDLAITTLIGITSKTFLKLPLLPSMCFPLPQIQRGKEEIGLLLLGVGLKEKCYPRKIWLVLLLFSTKYRASIMATKHLKWKTHFQNQECWLQYASWYNYS